MRREITESEAGKLRRAAYADPVVLDVLTLNSDEMDSRLQELVSTEDGRKKLLAALAKLAAASSPLHSIE